jgi:excisionase family DNA binding protein
MKTDDSHTVSMSTSEDAREALLEMVGIMPAEGAAQIRIDPQGDANGLTLVVPREALVLFVEVLGRLAGGHVVKVVSANSEISTHQAASILNVSRPFLIGLLEAGKIPFRKVGTHRRVRLSDLMAYKQKDDARRDEALAELTRQAQDLGLGY